MPPIIITMFRKIRNGSRLKYRFTLHHAEAVLSAVPPSGPSGTNLDATPVLKIVATVCSTLEYNHVIAYMLHGKSSNM